MPLTYTKNEKTLTKRRRSGKWYSLRAFEKPAVLKVRHKFLVVYAYFNYNGAEGMTATTKTHSKLV